MNPLGTTAIIVAGGNGTRMKSSVPKQYLHLSGKPVLFYTINAFLLAFPDISIVLVAPQIHQQLTNDCLDLFNENKRRQIKVVKGGETRFHSVQNGLRTVKEDGIIFVHDGVRPLVDPQLIKNCYYQALEKGTAVPAIEIADSIRILKGTHFEICDRSSIRIIQTPQTFQSDILKNAYGQPYAEKFTDDASVVEASGVNIHLVPGAKANIKITTPEDLDWAEYYLKHA